MIIESTRTYDVVETNGSVAIVSTFAGVGDTVLAKGVSAAKAGAFVGAYVMQRAIGRDTFGSIRVANVVMQGVKE